MPDLIVQPTKTFGVDCDKTKRPFLNKCGYNTAYEMLQHIYKNLQVAHFTHLFPST